MKFHNNEVELLKVRKHWFIFFIKLFPIGFLYILLLFAGFIFTVNITQNFEGAIWIYVYMVGLIGVVFWSFMFQLWLNYYLDIWIVTTRRVFDIEQHSFFIRDVSEFRLDKVQDISVEVRGLFHTLLNFGHIHVQTAGNNKEFLIKNIPDPHSVADLISKEVDKSLQKYASNYDSTI